MNEHGQEIVLLVHPNGSICEVHKYGATVTRFKTACGREVIWVSEKAKLDGSKAIRGGIPIVFPQFGRPDERMPQHGFVRNAKWTLLEGNSVNQESAEHAEIMCTLGIGHESATHEAWPHPYKLELAVKLLPSKLVTSLTVTNLGAAAFEFQTLLHTYYAVDHISHVQVGARVHDRNCPSAWWAAGHCAQNCLSLDGLASLPALVECALITAANLRCRSAASTAAVLWTSSCRTPRPSILRSGRL